MITSGGTGPGRPPAGRGPPRPCDDRCRSAHHRAGRRSSPPRSPAIRRRGPPDRRGWTTGPASGRYQLRRHPVPGGVRARVSVEEDDRGPAAAGPHAELDAGPDVDPRLVETLEEGPGHSRILADRVLTCGDGRSAG